MQSQSTPQPVIVGVTPNQVPHIVLQAARFAAQFRTELVCAHVDVDRFEVKEGEDGNEVSTAIDPDFDDDFEHTPNDWLHTELAEQLREVNIAWRSVMLAGDVPTALERLADRIDAAMIVVGAPEHPLTTTVHELFNLSVASNLAHHQARPVVVIPASKNGSTPPLLKVNQ